MSTYLVGQRFDGSVEILPLGGVFTLAQAWEQACKLAGWGRTSKFRDGRFHQAPPK